MDKVSTFVSRRPMLALAIAALLGLGLGLVLGWGLWPVQWTDAGPQHLRSDLQAQYLHSLAVRLEADNDEAAAKEALADWPDAAAVVQSLMRQETTTEAERQRLDRLSQALGGEGAAQTVPGGAFDAVRNVGVICLVGLFAVAVIGGVWALVQGRLGGLGRLLPARMGEEEVFEAQPEVETAAPARERRSLRPGAEPIGAFTTIYEFGDDGYDDSSAIENDNGEFLGEYGVSIAEAIGVGEPRKVTALEVWLFDKNDIRTVTQVLMSEHAYYDDAFRAKLAPKGEAVLARVGETLVLETASLTLHARVVDLEYREGNLPPQSVFERAAIEMTAWVRPGSGEGAGVRQRTARGT
jgi:hypothetical protein